MKDTTNKEEKTAESPETRWAISLDWLDSNNRSATMLISEHLCPDCASKLNPGKKEPSPEELISIIQNCCSNTPEFISHRLPVMESVFRLFLGNGNQSMGLDEVGQRLSQLSGGDSYRTSPEALLRLLKNDRYYGLQEISP
jgi:hypothetical protein